MENITETFYAYRECVRSLWNTHFIHLLTPENKWDIKDRYDEICVKVFSLYMTKLDDEMNEEKSLSYNKNKFPLMSIAVKPKVEHGVPIKINRDTPSIGYWDYPKDVVRPDDVELRFIDFFDFNVVGYRDFEYFLVRIIESNSDKELVGRDALISVKYANVFWT